MVACIYGYVYSMLQRSSCEPKIKVMIKRIEIDEAEQYLACSEDYTGGFENAVFYLRARGLSEKSAKELLVSAFISDVINKIENEEVLSFTNSYLNKEFGWNIEI